MMKHKISVNEKPISLDKEWESVTITTIPEGLTISDSIHFAITEMCRIIKFANDVNVLFYTCGWFKAEDPILLLSEEAKSMKR